MLGLAKGRKARLAGSLEPAFAARRTADYVDIAAPGETVCAKARGSGGLRCWLTASEQRDPCSEAWQA